MTVDLYFRKRQILIKMKRESGLLMPIFSLPSKYGIGDFGKEAYNFIDFLSESNQRVWEILPLVQTGYGNSPYSSVCSSSYSVYYISPEMLFENGLIKRSELNSTKHNGKNIDYGFLYQNRIALLRKAFSRFDRSDEGFVKFIKSKRAFDFALFTSIKNAEGQKPFYEWRKDYKFRNKKALKEFEKKNSEEILFWQFTQYLAEREWFALKKYANMKGVKILGDMPLYVSGDSVDVWLNPSLFKLNDDLTPRKVAGVPPDYFSSDGQFWGNPVYDYEMHKIEGFAWWKKRVKHALKLFDLVRIDHFRGLDRYYQIDSKATTAKDGEWVEVPSDELFSAIHSVVNKDKIIAEDLGIIDDGVRNLLAKNGYPGMKILSFAFNGDKNNPYLPKNVEENAVCFTGTHDNDTLIGLIGEMCEEERKSFALRVRESLKVAKIKLKITDERSLARAIIELGFNSRAKLFILPFADLTYKNSDYRINEPGKLKEQNWAVKFSKKDFTSSVLTRLKTLSKKYKRK